MANDPATGAPITAIPIPDPSTIVAAAPTPENVRLSLQVLLVQIVQVGVLQHQNFVAFNKQLDLDWLENHRLVGQQQAVADRILAGAGQAVAKTS